MISDHERLLTVFAEITEKSIGKVHRYVHDEAEWVDSTEEAKKLMARFRGILIASLCGELEELLDLSFGSLINQLPNTKTTKEDRYWYSSMPINSTLMGRAATMWAIRLAYTHGNGQVSRISNPKFRSFLSENHFSGLEIESGMIIPSGEVTFAAVYTAIDIYERLK